MLNKLLIILLARDGFDVSHFLLHLAFSVLELPLGLHPVVADEIPCFFLHCPFGLGGCWDGCWDQQETAENSLLTRWNVPSTLSVVLELLTMELELETVLC